MSYLRGALDPGLIETVRAVVDELEKDREAELKAKGGREGISQLDAITFSAHLVVKSKTLRDFTRNPDFAELCRDLIGPDVNLYWDQAVYKKPENPRRFPWHQDNGYTFVLPQQYLTCWTPLTSATIQNGCPQIVPGVHRLGTLQAHLRRPPRLGVLRATPRGSRPHARRTRRHCGFFLTGSPPDRPQHDRRHT